jgi:hypothetical protein
MCLTKQIAVRFLIVSMLTLASVGVPVAASDGQDQADAGLALDESLVALNTEKGEKLLAGSDARKSFIPLMMHFTTQNDPAYCGAASSAIVLNAIGIRRPVSPDHAPYRLFTQTSIFTPEVRKIIEPKQCSRSGMTLAVLGQVLRTYPVDVVVTYAKNVTADNFRSIALRTLRDSDSFLIVNYLRKAIHQEAGGHISPIAAYDASEDRLLILDVARYKYPPVWVKVDALFTAMSTSDGNSRSGRGFVVVRKRSPAIGR